MNLLIGYLVTLSCHNPCDDVKYYDFSTMDIIVMNPVVDINDSLVFQLRPLDVEYLAYQYPVAGMANTALAFDCDDGWGGMKHDITKTEITSNADFSDRYPAGSSLNDIVTIDALVEPHKIQYSKLETVDLSKSVWSNMYIDRRPTLDSTHQLTVALYKSDGETITTESGEIVWE